MLLIKEIECSNRHYLLNSGISVVFVIDCKPRQITVRKLSRKLDKCEIYVYFILLGYTHKHQQHSSQNRHARHN